MTYKTYPVLELSLDDVLFMYREDIDDPVTDEETTDYAKRAIAFAQKMDDGQWAYLANEIGDWLWNGDTWDEALRVFLGRMLKEHEEAQR